jgi:hypothetical protein
MEENMKRLALFPVAIVLLMTVGVGCGGDGPVTPETVSVAVTTSVGSGTQVIVDGSTVSAPRQVTWEDGSTHSIGVPSPQSAGVGSRYVYESWSDGGAQTHNVTVTSDATFTAALGTEYECSATASPSGAGSVEPDPVGSWYAPGTSIQVTAVAGTGWLFDHWEGDLTGTANPADLTMDGPKSVTAVFTAVEFTVVVTTSVGAGTDVAVDGATVAAPHQVSWQEAVAHSIDVPSPQSAGAGTRYVYASWSDGGAQTHQVAVTSDSTFTATLGTEYELSTTASPSGAGSVDLDPAGSWYAPGTSVQLTAVAGTGWAFDHWEGDLTGTANPADLTMDGPKSVTAVFVAVEYTVVVTTSVGAGTDVAVDGATVAAPHQVIWQEGVAHDISVPSPQSAGAGTRYVYASWSDAGAQTHQVAVTSDSTFTAALGTEYELGTAVSPSGAGSVDLDPAGAWYASGTSVQLTAVANTGWTFDHWEGDLTGTTNPADLTMDGPKSVTAVFAAVEYTVVVTTSVGAGTDVTVDGSTVAAPHQVVWLEGVAHSIGVPSPQSAGAGTRYVYASWSDGGAQAHQVAVTSDSTFTAAMGTEHELGTAVSPAGAGSVDLDPAGPWYASGTSVQLTAVANSGWIFDHWEGDLSGSANPANLTMDGPKSVTAVFGIDYGSVSGRVYRVEDSSALPDREVLLIVGQDTTRTQTDANGDYAFSDVTPQDYTVVADTAGLELFGDYVPGREQNVTVGPGQDVTGVDFGYRLAVVTVRTLASQTPVTVGTTVTISLELDVSEIPVPIAGLVGEITWSAATADFTEGSEAGAVWDILVVNEDPTGTLKFSAVSIMGVGGDVLLALTFDVVATAVGGAEFDPLLTEISGIDPDTGASIDVLAVVTLVEELVTVTVQ